jgi:hypothetical protein
VLKLTSTRSHHPMGTTTHSVLRRGLSKLKKQVKAQRDALLECVNKCEKISEADEEWLDQDANFVDEEALVEKLNNASDYERKLTRLTSMEQLLFKKLMGMGNGTIEVAGPGKKRKRKYYLLSCRH